MISRFWKSKENPEVTAEEVTRKWKQFYKEHGDYGMQYEEGAEKMKIAYQRKHELWLEQVNYHETLVKSLVSRSCSIFFLKIQVRQVPA